MQKNTNINDHEILKNLSITALNDMQQTAVQQALTNNNLAILAPTGSGKTLAFLLIVLHKLQQAERGVQAIIVAPARELALQIEQVFKSMKTNFKVSCCYGGHSMKIEQNSLSEAPAVLIATPGRLADHIHRQSFDTSTLKIIVLDEFDKSLQMGFHAEIEVLFKSINGKQQHILTSATQLNALPDFMPFTTPATLNYLQQQQEDPKLELKLVRTRTADKVDTLMQLVAGFNQEACLVFCNHREAVERISSLFKNYKFEHGIFHGAMDQIDREKNLIRFRGGAHNVLIATDLAARGLDIPEIRHVVHYQLPPHYDAFIHRNGRTARMHATGKAYLILAEDESLPPYIDKSMQTVVLSTPLQLPPPPKFTCLYINAGKKDKVSKGDIVGLLTKKGGLMADDLGLITTLDHASYVSVKRNLVGKLLVAIKDEKLKKLKVKIEIAN